MTVPPKGLDLPGNQNKKPVSPKVTDDFKGVPTSNDWWSSLIWENDTHGPNPYSDPMYAHPMALRAEANGLGFGYPATPQTSQYQYMYWYSKDVSVGLEAMNSPDTRVAAYSDWTVTASWHGGGSELRATFGHGLPFVYFTRKGHAGAVVRPQHANSKAEPVDVKVWHQGDEWLGFTVGGRDYGAFGPTGSEWRASGDGFVSDLAGKDFFSVAVLPDRDPETAELFRASAYAFVTDTKATWTYDQATSTVSTRFETMTELKESGHGHINEPLVALYRHQWLNTSSSLLAKSYASPRGEMKLMKGSSFVTKMPFNGVLPILPNMAKDNQNDLAFYVKQVHWQRNLFPVGLGDRPQKDSYWDGKSMMRIANLLQIADQIGAASAHDYLLQALKNELEDWFDGREPSALYYDRAWRTLIPVPAGFYAGLQLNDHHFHYGYFVFAAAIVARYDPAWAARWSENVDQLIRDAANWDRRDQRFPFLRYFDVYAGHSWANGPAQFDEGNNEESSSEDVNFAAGVILWGALTEKPAIRDLGIFLYSQEATAIEQYWWNIDGGTFPKGFDHSAVAMVWGAGGRYDTWWDSNPIFVHGINVTPSSGGSLYMGRHPDYVLRNYEEVVRRNRGQPLTWRDLLWMYLALAQPERARQLFDADRYFTPEFGNSVAMTYHWITNLAALGRLDIHVTGCPTCAVFEKEGRRTHVGFNPTGESVKVRFSDGATLDILPRAMSTDPHGG